MSLAEMGMTLQWLDDEIMAANRSPMPDDKH